MSDVHDQRDALDALLAATVLLGEDMGASLARDGLTRARAHLLWVVHRGGPVTQRALADALAVTPRNVTTLVEALQTSGHVTRAPHPDDRRALLVSLTDRGAAAMTAMDAAHGALAARLFGPLSPAELAAFTTTLGAVTARLGEAAAEAAP